MFDFVGVSILVALAFAFAWLARRAWNSRRAIIKWAGGGLFGLLAIVLLALLGAGLYGFWTLNRSYDNPLPQLSVGNSPERSSRGAEFEPICASCHAPEPGAPMTGQDFLGEEGAPPIGEFWAPNLTPVHLADWTDGEIFRAIREGVHASGRSLMIMPSSAFRNLSDEDAISIVAYLRSLPEEGQETPTNRLNVLGAVMTLVAQISEAQEPVPGPVDNPPAGPNAARGAYLSSLTCNQCHGGNHLGDPESGTPPLLAIPLAWSEEQFIQFMRTGTRPDGTDVNETMPWKELSQFMSKNDDLRAIYVYLRQVAQSGPNSG